MTTQEHLDGLPKNLFRFGFSVKESNREPLTPERVNVASNWVANNYERSKTLYRNQSSYGIKHVAERALGEYVSNGEIIAAMILCGFAYKQEGPNAYFYIKPV